MSFPEALRAVAGALSPDFDSAAALSLGVRTGLSPSPASPGDARRSMEPDASAFGEQVRSPETGAMSAQIGPVEFLNSETSLLEFNTRVLALVPAPGFPARAYVAPNGRIYEGTYDNPSGSSQRSRVLEYLNSIRGSLPEGVNPVLGPDATGVGWVYQYALQSKDKSLADLRSLQDWTIRYGIAKAEGVDARAQGTLEKAERLAQEAEQELNFGAPVPPGAARFLSADHLAARSFQRGALDREVLIEGRYSGVTVKGHWQCRMSR